MNRKHQLVLQWPAPAVDALDAVLGPEELLRENLSDESRVDSHDLGSGEMNIFILTDKPESVFDSARGILQNHAPWAQVRAAYRKIDREDYAILWPADLKTFRVA
jgi:hypothetical protein